MGTLKVGSVMFVQVERPYSTDWVLGSVSEILSDSVTVEGTVVTRVERATGLSVEPDVSATVTVPMELVDSDEAEVLEW